MFSLSEYRVSISVNSLFRKCQSKLKRKSKYVQSFKLNAFYTPTKVLTKYEASIICWDDDKKDVLFFSCQFLRTSTFLVLQGFKRLFIFFQDQESLISTQYNAAQKMKVGTVEAWSSVTKLAPAICWLNTSLISAKTLRYNAISLHSSFFVIGLPCREKNRTEFKNEMK